MSVTKSKPPVKAKPSESVPESAINKIIRKGAPPKQETMTAGDGQQTKQINVKILVSEIAQITHLRKLRPVPRGKRLAISMHDWIIEAIQEKIERDQESAGEV
jgi:3-hydroxyacyl-CoA dehydrogenase